MIEFPNMTIYIAEDGKRARIYYKGVQVFSGPRLSNKLFLSKKFISKCQAVERGEIDRDRVQLTAEDFAKIEEFNARNQGDQS